MIADKPCISVCSLMHIEGKLSNFVTVIATKEPTQSIFTTLGTILCLCLFIQLNLTHPKGRSFVELLGRLPHPLRKSPQGSRCVCWGFGNRNDCTGFHTSVWRICGVRGVYRQSPHGSSGTIRGGHTRWLVWTRKSISRLAFTISSSQLSKLFEIFFAFGSISIWGKRLTWSHLPLILVAIIG